MGCYRCSSADPATSLSRLRLLSHRTQCASVLERVRSLGSPAAMRMQMYSQITARKSSGGMAPRRYVTASKAAPNLARAQARYRILTQISSHELVVLSMDRHKTGTLRRTLGETRDYDSQVLCASGLREMDALEHLLKRRPMTAKPREEDDDEDDGKWEESPDHQPSGLACLLIAHLNTETLSWLDSLRPQIVRWAKAGGVVMLHGTSALELLADWFGQRKWSQMRNVDEHPVCYLNETASLAPRGSLWNDLPMHLNTEEDRAYLSKVANAGGTVLHFGS